MKKKIILVVIVIYYIISVVFIGLGFIVGDNYEVYDSPRACSNHANAYWQKLYGWEKLETMFDGCIHKREGWYGFSWRQVYNMYQRGDQDEEVLKNTISVLFKDMEYDWSDEEFVNYISDRGARFKHDYVFIRLNDEVLFIEYGPTNVEEDYEGAVTKTIIICSIVVFAPILMLLFIFIKKRLSKSTNKNNNNEPLNN